MTDATGATMQGSTYYPFGGEQRLITNPVDNRYKFTGMLRDPESALALPTEELISTPELTL